MNTGSPRASDLSKKLPKISNMKPEKMIIGAPVVRQHTDSKGRNTHESKDETRPTMWGQKFHVVLHYLLYSRGDGLRRIGYVAIIRYDNNHNDIVGFGYGRNKRRAFGSVQRIMEDNVLRKVGVNFDALPDEE